MIVDLPLYLHPSEYEWLKVRDSLPRNYVIVRPIPAHEPRNDTAEIDGFQ